MNLARRQRPSRRAVPILPGTGRGPPEGWWRGPSLRRTKGFSVASGGVIAPDLPPAGPPRSLAPHLPVRVEVENHVLLAVLEQAQAPRDLLIGLGLAAQVAAEAVLVELFARRH